MPPTRDGCDHVRENLARNNPAWELLGIRLARLEEGLAELELCVRPQALNPHGAVHGGIVTALADAAGGCALYTRLTYGARLATVELKVNFLAPVTADARATARVVHVGSTLGVSSVEVSTGRSRPSWAARHAPHPGAAEGACAAVGLITYRVWPPREAGQGPPHPTSGGPPCDTPS